MKRVGHYWGRIYFLPRQKIDLFPFRSLKIDPSPFRCGQKNRSVPFSKEIDLSPFGRWRSAEGGDDLLMLGLELRG